MALTLKTPGVYTEEKKTLGSSVAQVATAIPAFIGFTEKAMKTTIGDLDMVPTRITSMLEYEAYFGKADNETGIKVFVTDGAINPQLSQTLRKPFLMYYALQMFFANGGGACYIISTGDYSDGTPDFDKLKDGLAELEKEDEPTLIHFPDAVNLSSGNLYSLNNLALQQCNKLKDRFTVIDTQMSDVLSPNITSDISTLRGAISTEENEVKYGAAYYPYVNTILDYQYEEAAVSVSISASTSYATQVQNIVDTSITPANASMLLLMTDLANLAANVANPPTGTTAFSYKNSIILKVQQILGTARSIHNSLGDVLTISNSVSNPSSALSGAITNLDNWIAANPEQYIPGLEANLVTLQAASSSNAVQAEMLTIMATAGEPVSQTDLADTMADYVLGAGAYMPLLVTQLTAASSTPVVTNLAALATSDNVLYNRIKLSLSDMPMIMPPASAVLGVYAKTDANEGVWKAPANTSLNYVLGPVVTISSDKQDDMNVDSVAGKSVNAIRAFTGRGTLIWGARTLNGNSNEWRYISVRRFYNFAEESIKKATEAYVFDSNDANTWTQVRAMIEAFLTLQWKAGALAGAKPEQAFFVRVGLGETMTPDDVLNGRMIVEVGMAVVRPAEFIVLRFSHMLQS